MSTGKSPHGKLPTVQMKCAPYCKLDELCVGLPVTVVPTARVSVLTAHVPCILRCCCSIANILHIAPLFDGCMVTGQAACKLSKDVRICPVLLALSPTLWTPQSQRPLVQDWSIYDAICYCGLSLPCLYGPQEAHVIVWLHSTWCSYH